MTRKIIEALLSHPETQKRISGSINDVFVAAWKTAIVSDEYCDRARSLNRHTDDPNMMALYGQITGLLGLLDDLKKTPMGVETFMETAREILKIEELL